MGRRIQDARRSHGNSFHHEAHLACEIFTAKPQRSLRGAKNFENRIHVFKRNPADGKLAFVDSVFCGGRMPRHFAIAPGGKWLLCGHQDSDTISVLPLDPVTGKLGEAVHTVSCPGPICILFAR